VALFLFREENQKALRCPDDLGAFVNIAKKMASKKRDKMPTPSILAAYSR
jgi:hypothetical protein